MSDILVVVEQHDGIFKKSTLAAFSAANAYAGLSGGAVDALVIGSGVAGAADAAAGYGAHAVFVADAAEFKTYLATSYASALASFVSERGYAAVFATATTFGKDLLPRLSGLLDAPLASDIVGLVKEGDRVAALRPMYAGNAIATVALEGSCALFTVRQTAFDPAPASSAKSGVAAVALPSDPCRTAFVSRQETKSARPELVEARVIVSIGRGLKGPENLPVVEELADLLKAALGASRAAVDAGWVPNDLQVGQTGKIVAPELYFALGISGAIQHLAGMKDSKVIVAVNKDADAPVFQVADYGLVADMFKAVPEIVAEIRKG